MFLLSRVFVWPSLARKGCWDYLCRRVLRLDLPFGLAVLVPMPLALYPVYLVTAVEPNVAAFWQSYLALPFWPTGPAWFLWQLLVLNEYRCRRSRTCPWLGNAAWHDGIPRCPSGQVIRRAGGAIQSISSRDQRNLTDVSVAEVVVDLAVSGPLTAGMKVDVYFRRDNQ